MNRILALAVLALPLCGCGASSGFNFDPANLQLGVSLAADAYNAICAVDSKSSACSKANQRKAAAAQAAAGGIISALPPPAQ